MYKKIILFLFTFVFIFNFPLISNYSQTIEEADREIIEKKTYNYDMVWHGYLYQNSNGEITIGQPGVRFNSFSMHHVSQVIGEKLVKQLKQFVSDWKYYIADYTWIGIENKSTIVKIDAEGLPRHIVKLHGDVTEEITVTKSKSITSVSTTGYLMTKGRLLSIEFLNIEWIKQLQNLANLQFDPWPWPPEEKKDKISLEEKLKVKNQAEKILSTLLTMRRYSRITDEMRERVKKVDPNAIAVRPFQGWIERVIHEWLINKNKEYNLNLKGLELLGVLPPSREEVQNKFNEAKSKEEFLKLAQSNWKEYFDELIISYMHKASRGEAWGKRLTLSEMSKNWSEEDFQRYKSNR